MADGKSSFVLYADYIHIFEKLEDVEAGKLAKHLFRYVNDQDPIAPDKLIDIAFEPIKQQLKRDLKAWNQTTGERSKSGSAGNLKRYHPDLYKRYLNNEITIEEAWKLAKDRKDK